ncbi:Mitochondrial substrate/solute carrier [Dillenia turbinata]|uniref:Mitochondrial substrate/solute carrier n=1 Tax=Dillenia turbinata TaxID=194707 RepID=A0AAN8V264_9MAGN
MITVMRGSEAGTVARTKGEALKKYGRQKHKVGKKRSCLSKVKWGVCGCDRFSSGSIRDVFRRIVKKDGYSVLMRGWIPRMLFHAPAAAICWSTYEASKNLFRASNGSNSPL